MGFEDEYVGRKRNKSKIGPWLPALGFLLMVSFAGVAYVLSEPVHQFVYEQFLFQSEINRGIMRGGPDSFDQVEIQYFVGAVLFVLMMLVVATLYALFAPKPSKMTAESELKKERQEAEAQRKREKIRRQRMNKQYAKEREVEMRENEERSRQIAAKRRPKE